MPISMPPQIARIVQGGVPAALREVGIPPWLADIVGFVAPDPTVPYAFGRIGVMPGRERLASRLTREGLRGPWFHGTSAAEDILGRSPGGPEVIPYLRHVLSNPLAKQDFPPETLAKMTRDLAILESGKPLPLLPGQGFGGMTVGSSTGLRLGEPAGVSLTRSPEVARNFGDVLRVGVDIPPSSVGKFVDPGFQTLLRKAYSYGTDYPVTASGSKSWILGDAASLRAQSEFARRAGKVDLADKWLGMAMELEAKAAAAPHTLGDLLTQHGPVNQAFPKSIQEQAGTVNKRMSDYLRSQGVEAIEYNPRRWDEYELRVLDTSKAVPLGRLEFPPIPPGEENLARYVLNRYLHGPSGPAKLIPEAPPNLQFTQGGLRRKLAEEYVNAPSFPVRLRDILVGVEAN